MNTLIDQPEAPPNTEPSRHPLDRSYAVLALSAYLLE
jgi:hypothetical protein